MPAMLRATETHLFMSIDAPFSTRLHAATGMAGGARPTTMMFTIITTRTRGGTG